MLESAPASRGCSQPAALTSSCTPGRRTTTSSLGAAIPAVSRHSPASSVQWVPASCTWPPTWPIRPRPTGSSRPRWTPTHVDALVANHARSSGLALEDLTAGELDLTFAVNTRATLLLVRAFAAQHDEREGGRIVLFTSGQHLGPMPAELPYVASKGSLHQLTPSLADHLSGRGITVNCVNPGPTDTGYLDRETIASVLERFPAGRWGSPDDAARLVAWLLSDDARWITGQVLNSEGGFRR